VFIKSYKLVYYVLYYRLMMHGNSNIKNYFLLSTHRHDFDFGRAGWGGGVFGPLYCYDH